MELSYYYIDIKIDKLEELINLDTSSLNKRDRNIIKFKKYITELYQKQDYLNNYSLLNYKILDRCFSHNYYYKNIHQDNNRIETVLFNRIGYRKEKGSNHSKKISKYKLNNSINNYLQNLDIKDIKLIPYKQKKKDKENYIINYIKINRNHLLSSIQSIEEQIKNSEDKDIKNLKIQELYYILFLEESKRTNKIKLQYEVKPSGRLYSQYSNLRRDIRHNLLIDYNEYDISTASYRWLHDIAKQIEEDIELPTLKYYLENKKEVRYTLAKALNTEYEVIKEIITALGFGARETITDIEYYSEETLELEYFRPNAIENILYKYNIDTNIFKNLITFNKFIEEVKQAMKVVSDYHKTKYYNRKKKTLEYSKKNILKFKNRYSKSKALAFLYQIYESNFLLSMRDTYKKETKDKNYFLLHDAIYTLKDIDIKTLEESKQNLEFKINWKLEKE